MGYENSCTINSYKDTMKQLLMLYTDCDDGMLDNAIDYSIKKRYKKERCRVENSYTKQTSNMTLLALADYINSREPIVTAHGTMFAKHADAPNPLTKVIQLFLDQRGIDKKKMLSFPKGSEEYEKYY